ncbi:MAG: flippase-like domain-containing protein [Oscillospiraceae bacterium]|nr:flippase-like domain-containing protein [Oscillospiraceae bacterium]
MTDKTHTKKADRKRLYRFLFFVAINIAIVGYIALHEFGTDAKDVQKIAKLDVNLLYLLFAIACLGVAILMETLKYKAMMVAAEGRDDFRGAFECAVLGKYYDNITPLGAGGQPFQIVYLKKRGLSTGTSAALPIAGFLVLQAAFVLLAAVVFIFNGSVAQDIDAIRISAYVGLVFYLFIPVCIVLFACVPHFFGKIVCVVAKVLSRLHIVKDYDAAVGNIFGSLGEYTASLKLLHNYPHLYGKLLLYSGVYQVAILSIPFFVLRAFGGTNSWWTVFSMVVYIYAAITIVPTPGNSGAAEGSFYAVFSALTSGYLFWAMLIWRLLVYYAWLILGLTIITRSAMSPKKQPKKRAIPDGPLRVAQFSDLFYPSIDGVVRTVDAYAKRLNSGGGYCCVVCPRGKIPYQDDSPYDVIRTPAIRVPGISYPCPVPVFSRSLHRFFQGKQFDVFHVHSPFFVGRFAVWLGRKMDIPLVATFHSKYYDDALNITHSRFLARLTANYTVSFYSKADAVWACSSSTADTLRSYGFRGEIEVMENGVEPCAVPDPEALRKRAREAFSLPAGKRILLFVGQQIWQKNLRMVLDVTKRLQKDGGYLTVIVGKGYDREAITSYADSLNLGDSVKFTGGIADRELLRGLYLASDLFFFPSLYDNAPLVLRESAQMGLPALLVAGSNSAEIVKDGVNGYTAENDRAAMTAKIQAIFAGGDRVAVGKKAQETIPVSWDVIVQRAEKRYRLLKKRSYAQVNVRESQMELERKGSDR